MTDSELLDELTQISDADEAPRLFAIHKCHDHAGVRKEAKRALQRVAPTELAEMSAVFKGAISGDDRKFNKKLLQLDANGFAQTRRLALEINAVRDDDLGLTYLCALGGDSAVLGLERAIEDGHLSLDLDHVPDELAQLPMRTLRLFNLRAKELPRAILELENLEALELHYGKVTSLPDEITRLPRLKTLRLNGAPVKKLPASLFSLPLELLEIFNAQLETIPDELGQLKSTLRVLTIQNCHKLKMLPSSLSELDGLRRLQVRLLAMVTEVPPVWGLKHLEMLALQSCGWSGLQPPVELGDLAELVELDLGHSKLVELPESIGALKNLTRLKVWYNSELKRLPEGFFQLPSLNAVGIRDCPVDTEEIQGRIQAMNGVELLLSG